MSEKSTQLVCTCWTHAGNVAPLWATELSPLPIEERVAAVAASGWSGIGFSQDDLRAVRDGTGFPELRDRIRDAGIGFTEVEILNHWWLEGAAAGQSREMEALLFDAAEQLGAAHIKIATAFGDPLPSVEPLVQPLRALAERAADRGVRLALEPLPFSMVATVPAGAELVKAVDHRSCGLAVDAWHVFRAGTPLTALPDALTADIVFAVELDDAVTAVEGTLFEDTINGRRLCGEGDFDVVGFVTTMRDIGFDGPWGVEIISAEHRARPLEEAVQVAYETGLRTVKAGLAGS